MFEIERYVWDRERDVWDIKKKIYLYSPRRNTVTNLVNLQPSTKHIETAVNFNKKIILKALSPFSSVEKYFFYEQNPSVVSIFINNIGKGDKWVSDILWKIVATIHQNNM